MLSANGSVVQNVTYTSYAYIALIIVWLAFLAWVGVMIYKCFNYDRKDVFDINNLDYSKLYGTGSSSR